MVDGDQQWPVREIQRLYVEIDKRDVTIERMRLDFDIYKANADERLRKLELANAISGGLTGFKRYLVGLIIAILGIAGGIYAGRGKLF